MSDKNTETYHMTVGSTSHSFAGSNTSWWRVEVELPSATAAYGQAVVVPYQAIKMPETTTSGNTSERSDGKE